MFICFGDNESSRFNEWLSSLPTFFYHGKEPVFPQCLFDMEKI